MSTVAGAPPTEAASAARLRVKISGTIWLDREHDRELWAKLAPGMTATLLVDVVSISGAEKPTFDDEGQLRELTLERTVRAVSVWPGPE